MVQAQAQSNFFRPTQARIDLRALKSNVSLAQSLLKGSGQLIPIVKANAYGHGSLEIALLLKEMGIASLGVATVEEALILRQGGFDGRILILGGPMEAPVEVLQDFALEPCLFEMASLEGLEKNLKKPLGVSIKVDTGMGRLGFWPEDLDLVLKKLKASSVLKLKSVFSHLASAENPESEAVLKQREVFEKVRKQVQKFFPCLFLLRRCHHLHPATGSAAAAWPR